MPAYYLAAMHCRNSARFHRPLACCPWHYSSRALPFRAIEVAEHSESPASHWQIDSERNRAFSVEVWMLSLRSPPARCWSISSSPDPTQSAQQEIRINWIKLNVHFPRARAHGFVDLRSDSYRPAESFDFWASVRIYWTVRRSSRFCFGHFTKKKKKTQVSRCGVRCVRWHTNPFESLPVFCGAVFFLLSAWPDCLALADFGSDDWSPFGSS